jgi:hypothetical protein
VILNCLNEGECPSPRGDNSKSKNALKIFKTLLHNQEANFNQTWYKSSLGKENSKLFKIGPGPLQRGDNYKNGVGSFKNLIQKH